MAKTSSSLQSLVTLTCLLLIQAIIMMNMVTSPYFNALPWIPLQAASKGATLETSMSTAGNSAILKSPNTKKTHQDVIRLFLIYRLACLKFQGYSRGDSVLEFNSCDLTKYEKQISVRTYLLD